MSTNIITKSSKKASCAIEGISIVIPCFEESMHVLLNTIHSIVNSIKSISNVKHEVIVVDDGSKSKDYSEVEQIENCYLIRHKLNRGYGSSLATGINHSTYPWIGIIDADNTYPAECFPELIHHAGDFEMVIGARNWSKISFARRPAKLALTVFASYLSNHKISDLNSGMRVFHKSIYEANWRIYPDRYSFSSTLTMAAITYCHDVKFIKIDYKKRVGKSSISPIRDTLRFFYQLMRLSLYFRPLRIFMPLSALCLVFALARGTRDYIVTEGFGGLTLVLFFMAFQIFFFGLIAEIINKK